MNWFYFSVPFCSLNTVGDGLMAMKKEYHQLKQLCREDFLRLIKNTNEEMEKVNTVYVYYVYACMYLYVYICMHACNNLMLWLRQTLFESKGDKLSFSAEYGIRSCEVWDIKSPEDWKPTHKPTELSKIKLKLELSRLSLLWASIQSTWLHCRLLPIRT